MQSDLVLARQRGRLLSSPDTENGEHGASTIWVIEPGLASW